MILVGIESCKSCKVVKIFLKEIPYIELKHGIRAEGLERDIKKVLGILNPSGRFPVILNDTLNKIVDTSFLLENLDTKKIQNKLAIR